MPSTTFQTSQNISNEKQQDNTIPNKQVIDQQHQDSSSSKTSSSTMARRSTRFESKEDDNLRVTSNNDDTGHVAKSPGSPNKTHPTSSMADVDDSSFLQTSPHSNNNNSHVEEDLDAEDSDAGGIKEQDLLLPIANVSRLMKQAVPSSAKVSKEAKETVQACVSEFIAFISSEACDHCAAEKRKTITGEDVVWAMETLGFDQYAHVMKLYLAKYREVAKMSPSLGAMTAGNETVTLTPEEQAQAQELLAAAFVQQSNQMN